MSRPAPAAGPVVLIVDDERDILDSLSALLEHALPGTTVVGRTKASEALEFASQNRVDVVLVDYRVNDANGIDFLEELRRVKPDVPAILITAYAGVDVLVEAVNRGRVEGLFTKPFDEAGLLATVRRLAGRRAGTVGRIPAHRPLRGATAFFPPHGSL